MPRRPSGRPSNLCRRSRGTPRPDTSCATAMPCTGGLLGPSAYPGPCAASASTTWWCSTTPPAPRAARVSRLLPRDPDSSVPRQGRPGTQTGGVSGSRAHRQNAHGRRPPSSLQPPGSMSPGRRRVPTTRSPLVFFGGGVASWPERLFSSPLPLPPAESVPTRGSTHASPVPWLASEARRARPPTARGPPRKHQDG